MTKSTEQYNAEKVLRGLAKVVDGGLKNFAPGFGFSLIVFKFNEPGISNYISNAKRTDMIKALKETVERLEKGQDIPATIGPIQ